MTDAVISATIPCDARFVSLARLTATSLGAEVDLDVDDLEDLRMAANELVAVVIEWGVEHAHETVTLTYRLHAQGLELTAAADGASPDADNSRGGRFVQPQPSVDRGLVQRIAEKAVTNVKDVM